jgi:hypothetical protein
MNPEKFLVHLFLAAIVFWAFIIFMIISGHSAEIEYAIGDSIAEGLQLPGQALVGASPRVVLVEIGSMPVELYRGRVVILSSGVSNDPSEINLVPIQLKMLKDYGAKPILLGVGAWVPRFAGINDRLEGFARDADVPFLWGWSGVHPDNYKIVLANLRVIECQIYKICAA